MGTSLGNDNEDPISGINVTPFVDIILVVLIIFMVTAPMIMKPSINVNLPEAASGEATTETLLQITMNALGAIQLNGKPSDLNEVEAFSKEVLVKKPDIQAVIAADKEVSHGKVVHLIDVIKKAGIKKFAISIDQPQK